MDILTDCKTDENFEKDVKTSNDNNVLIDGKTIHFKANKNDNFERLFDKNVMFSHHVFKN